MKATAIAPANIAFIKYWGRKENRIPYNPSISMNLSNCFTKTTVEFSSDYKKDFVSDGFDEERIVEHLDRIRNIAHTDMHAKVTTKNSFPSGAGVASSASGFAALTLAATAALKLSLSEQQLSILARLGSGSAARSIPDGFVKWENEFAYSLYPADYWNLLDILVILDTKKKEISSSEGHEKAVTSPYLQKRLNALPNRIKRCEQALQKKDFKLLKEVIEEECLDMHRVMQTQTPPLFYWNKKTDEVIEEVKDLPVAFTVDAGPNVHLICEEENEKKVMQAMQAVKAIKYIIMNKPAIGAHLV